LADPAPWTFVVEQAQVSEGPWKEISPVLTNTVVFVDDVKRIVSKDHVLFFRIKMTTPTATYYSFVKAPYGDLNRREYLIVKDIMRREVLQQDDMAGILGRVWIRATSGPRCTNCIDPITGNVTVSNCRFCLGVGRIPPYLGPYDVYLTFTPSRRNLELSQDGLGLQQPYTWEIRLVGFPYLKDKDIALDIASDKRYIIDGVNNELEIRRIPVIQVLHANELPVSDPVYKLKELDDGDGDGDGYGGGCVLPDGSIVPSLVLPGGII